MTSGVAISRIERRHERAGERRVWALESGVQIFKVRNCFALGLVQQNDALQSNRRNQECADDGDGVQAIAIYEKRNERRVQQTLNHEQWPERAYQRVSAAGTPDCLCGEVKQEVCELIND